MTTELDEVAETVETLRDGFETLFVRGVAASSASDRKGLAARAEAWERMGAQHVASRARAALAAVDADSRDAQAKLLGAYTSLHSFERLLSLDVARETWDRYLASDSSPPPEDLAPALTPLPDVPPIDDPKGAAALLDDLVKVTEDLVRTGLTSATAATRAKLDASFKESSRRRLLRVGASLRYVNEEVGRFLADDGSFTARRYSFFLHRSWLLARGARRALDRGDATLFASLVGGAGAAPRPVGELDVIALGVAKRVLSNACTFDVRLRVTDATDRTLVGQSLVFSLVFARKLDVPPEAYLLLPQAQKYVPRVFREHAVLRITDAALLPGRLVLGPKSTVTQTSAAPFTSWTDHYGWDARHAHKARARVVAHRPSPLDLPVEMHEEMIVRDWQLERVAGRSTTEKEVFTLRAAGLTLDATVPTEAKELASRLLEASKKKKRPPLFGTVHYELGRVVFLPLALLHDDGPDHITLSNESFSLTKLLGTLDLK